MTEEPSTPPSPTRARPRPAPAPAPESAPADVTTDPRAEDDAPRGPKRRGPLRRWADAGGRRRPAVIAVTSAALAVVVAIVLAVTLLGSDGSSDRPGATTTSDRVAALDDPDLATAFIGGASSDIAAVTTYSYKTLDSDLANGEVVTTGAYRTSYRAALTGALAATARRLHRVQTFQLSTAGIGGINDAGTSAKVLMFGTQTVIDDSTGRKPQRTLVTLTATMARNGPQYRISALEADANAGLPPGSAALSDAAEAGREEVTNLLTVRRAQLAADDNQALSLAVEPLRSQLSGQSAGVRAAVRKGNYDLTGSVTAVAIDYAAGDTVAMFVAATGTRTTAAGRSSVVTDGRYEVVVVRVGGRWLVSRIVPVTAS